MNFTVRDGTITSTSEDTEIIPQIRRSGGSDTVFTFTAMCQGLVGVCMYSGFDNTGSSSNANVFPHVEQIGSTGEEFNVYTNITSRASTAGDDTTLFTISKDTSYPLTLDLIRFGQSNDGVLSGDRHNDSIIRLEVDETDLNSGVFVAELEYQLLNQLNEA